MSWRRVRTLIWKEFTQLRRDPMLLRLLMIMPVLQLILFGYVVAVDIKHLDTAVVESGSDVEVSVIGERRPARVLTEPAYDPSGSRMRL